MGEQSVDFIAQRPHILENDFKMPWPDSEVFLEMARNTFREVDEPLDESDWPFRNQVANNKGSYFRMRYRGEQWPWKDFHPEENLSEIPEVRLDQFLVKGYWAPAVDEALELYKHTGEERYRSAAVFSCGLHIYDALQHSWSFIDPKLKNDSGVREKQMAIFLYRVHDVAKLEMPEAERDYFDPLREQFQLAYAEIAAQSPVTAGSMLEFMDNAIRQTGEHRFYDKARSSLLNLTYLPTDKQHRIIERYKVAAKAALDNDFSSPYFVMAMLHLMGLATVADFYDRASDSEVEWWTLTAEEIQAGDVSNAGSSNDEQQSLF